MKQISLIGAGKRFNKDWIFQSLNVEFEQGQHYALIGNNGSGKSTLLQVIAGAVTSFLSTVIVQVLLPLPLTKKFST